MTLRWIIPALALLGAVLGQPDGARATITYVFTPTTATTYGQPVPASAVPSFAITLQDSATSDGFYLDGGGYSYDALPNWMGDISDFVSLVFLNSGGFDDVYPDHLLGTLDLSLNHIKFLGTITELDISMSGNYFSGYFGSDTDYCNNSALSQQCFESGTISQVLPEPSSLSIYSIGVLVLVCSLIVGQTAPSSNRRVGPVNRNQYNPTPVMADSRPKLSAGWRRVLKMGQTSGQNAP